MNRRQIPGINPVIPFLSLLLLLSFSGKGIAQTLTIANTGETAGWSLTDRTITVTSNATINSSTIQTYLNTGSLTIVGNTNNFIVNVNDAITSNTSGNGLTIGGNASNLGSITLSSDLSLAGPISIFGGYIFINSNITSTLAGADILFKVVAAIKVNAENKKVN
jgi:hypothetical protein